MKYKQLEAYWPKRGLFIFLLRKQSSRQPALGIAYTGIEGKMRIPFFLYFICQLDVLQTKMWFYDLDKFSVKLPLLTKKFGISNDDGLLQGERGSNSDLVNTKQRKVN